MKMLIYTKKKSARFDYAISLFFKWIYNLEYEIITSKEAFLKAEGIKINYSNELIKNSLQIIPSRILFEKEVKTQFKKIGLWKDQPIFFETKGDIPFDIFGAAFFLTARYEEYLPHKTDSLGRFDFEDSLAFKEGFLEKPLVNIWAKLLLKEIKEKNLKFSIPNKEYKFIPTIDVDNAYAFKNKGFIRTVGAYLRSIVTGDFEDVVERTQVIFGRKSDPYNVFEKVIKLEKDFNLGQILFFLLGDYDVNDKNVPPGNKYFQRLIKDVNDYVKVGIHPSFASNQNREKLKIEIERLNITTHRNVSLSRQHFLILHFPTTYRNLIEEGISDDYSMGYPQHVGFRASIADVYPFYDLETEQETKLIIHPFSAMEATFKYYKETKPEEVVKEIKKIADAIKEVDGTFYLLWHSDTLSGHRHWKGWQHLYEEVINASI